MNIQPLSSLSETSLQLQNIGVKIHALQSENDPIASIDQQEQLTLAGLQLHQFDSAYVVLPGARKIPLSINPEALSSTRLLESLQQIGNKVDLDSALELHHAASSLIASIRSQTDPVPAELVLAGAFGEIVLDLAQLQPDSLRKAFSTGLQKQPDTGLQHMHGQLADLAGQIRAGFEPRSKSETLSVQNWIHSALKTDHTPESFNHFLFGSRNQMLNGSLENFLFVLSQNTQEHNKPSDKVNSQQQKLAAQSNELIKLANQLEASLELAPRVDSPDILELLAQFLEILKQHEAELAQLFKQLASNNQIADELQKRFSERLTENLRFHQDELAALQGSGHDRLKLLIQKSLNQARTELELALDLKQLVS